MVFDAKLWRLFPDFHTICTVSIMTNRLIFIQESCRSFQTVSLSDLRNILLQILSQSQSRAHHRYLNLLGVWFNKIVRVACIDRVFCLEGATK